MTKIQPGPRTADVAAAFDADEDHFVVFIIGMRINKPWMVHQWYPVFAAMPKMLRELRADPELGMLNAHQFFGTTITLIQYWRSFDHLERFARGEHHLPAWRRFNKLLRRTDAVGFFHETYVVPIDSYETIYNNMPAFGLSGATANVPIGQGNETARARLESERTTPAEPTEVEAH